MDLFSEEKTILKRPNAELIYIKNFYNLDTANHYFKALKHAIKWQQDDIRVFGKTHKQPRLTALYANNDKPYSYSNITMKPNRFTSDLLQIKTDIENKIKHQFTTILLNLYRNGSDSNGWHADNEKALGLNPIIASLSFGETRPFHFKHRTIKDEKHQINLHHGSLLIMKGEMQHYWLHQIPKTKKPIRERINLTFRTLI
ncbi:alpha-ketoglutarate-dependent dioxygenase AlkB [Flavobacteriales bacterium 33_180_T64]|nr:alpha-ketoglutarate-dependent dioxygenase AlkB [Flavobacteriales bacterium 33_180_T64]